jgi:hypothetical protein
MNILTEAVIVGIGTIIIGIIIALLLNLAHVGKVDLPEVCKSWNKKYIMEISLFLIGFSAHLLCEVTGVNKAYVESKKGIWY